MDDTHERDDGTEGQTTGSRVNRRWFLGSTAAAATIGLAGCTNTDDGGDGGGDGGGGGGDGGSDGGDGGGGDGGSDGGDGGGGSSDPLVIGGLFPTSGPYASAGQGMRAAFELAVNTRFDSSVAGREVETIVRDTATAPETAVNEATSLINEENIDMMVGGFSSSVCLALQDIAGREGVPYFAGGGATLQANGKNCNRESYFAYASGWQYSGAGVTAYEQGILDSLFFIQADYAGGEGVYRGVTSVMESETDAQMMGRALAPLGADDYSSQISKARDSGADAVWAATVGADSIKLVKQAVSAGLTEDMEILVGSVGNSVGAALSDEELGAIHGGASFYWTAEGSGEFSDEFSSETGGPPEWWSSATFDATMEALTAVENTEGSTSIEDLNSALDGREFSWTRPGTAWRACDHRAIQPYYLLKGNPSGSDSGEYWSIIGETGGEQIMRSCEKTGCSL
ncbi:ABC transporter substrate-binding protein [Haloglomus litoreum]|uniref:ABC transporter substrate-binding protein n=1 Tax=Haloglomus litoreum TaxID=3034026 RepID=UPI0023E84076|nr:ABC transporter substrate-binding protein [Haloglomus sp. DT116]